MNSTRRNSNQLFVVAVLTLVIGMTAIVDTALGASAPSAQMAGGTQVTTSDRLGGKGIGDIPPELPGPPPSQTAP